MLSYLNCFFPMNVLTHCRVAKTNFYVTINGPRSQQSLRLMEQDEDNVKVGGFLASSLAIL